ncbi:MAG: hypothetical protein VSS75_025455 [Candidatus Parabeggiatoa sp.]
MRREASPLYKYPLTENTPSHQSAESPDPLYLSSGIKRKRRKAFS